MPAAAMPSPSGSGIPLSDVAAAAPAPASAVASTVPAGTALLEQEEQLPSFGTDEIEELVDEVEESPVETAVPPETPAVPADEPVAAPTIEVEAGDLPAAVSVDAPAAEGEIPVHVAAETVVPVMDEPAAAATPPPVTEERPAVEQAPVAAAPPPAVEETPAAIASTPVVEEQPVAAAPPPMESPPQFEVDHQMDPDWAPSAASGGNGGGIVAPAGGDEFQFPPVPAPPPDEVRSTAEQDAISAKEDVFAAAAPTSPGVEPPLVDEGQSADVGAEAWGETEPALSAVAQDETGDQVWELGGEQPLEDFGEPADDPAVLDALQRGGGESSEETPTAMEAAFADSFEGGMGEPPAEPDLESAGEQTWSQAAGEATLDPADEATVPAAAEGAELTLTDALEDSALFDDPSLDVARLGGKASREIVVPVELEGEEGSLRRYKLSIRLRLDPVD
jgi:hypothetical protein